MGQGSALLSRAQTASAEPIRKKAEDNLWSGTRGHKIHTGRWVRPGFAKSEGVIKKGSWNKSKTARSVYIGPTDKSYYMSQFQELGKNKKHQMPKREWLRPAIRSHQVTATTDFKRRLEKGIKNIAKRNAKAKK
jgi:hypothetical protein